VPQVRVLDRTFNEDAGRALKLIQVFRDEFPEIRFHLEIDPARVSDRLADALASAGPGRFHLEAGVQSLEESVGSQIGRQSTARRTLDGLQRLCGRRELEVHVDLIAGLPGGTLAGLMADVGTLIRLGPQEIQLERLKLLPGTPLAETPERWGLLGADEPPYQPVEKLVVLIFTRNHAAEKAGG
jgi:coproporphyrinogen III oxidase-like Fe-S oxidoreductase